MRIDNIKLKIGESEGKLKKIAEEKLRGRCGYLRILRKSLDARNKADIRWVYSVEAEKSAPESAPRVLPQTKRREKKIVVIGSGPAGLFCAVRLIEHGFCPIVLERGGNVDERAARNEKFFCERILDENTNVQFGEGGAGTFSDGKLNTQTHTPLNREVLETFVRFGAPEEILYLAKPHIGSDNLKNVVKNMRRYICSLGGEVCFHTLFDGAAMKGGAVYEALAHSVTTGERYRYPCDALVLAIGHSSRDTFAALLGQGFAMEQREFAIGARIEHLQEKIGLAQYSAWHKTLPPADYKLVSHAGARSAFTFCMCPGGYVMPASSERGGVVTNGMSNYARDGRNANSALLVQIRREDFDRGNVLDGAEFQRKIERAAFTMAGGDYSAPVQRAEDFFLNRESKSFGEVTPTYAAGTAMCDLNRLLPEQVAESMKSALRDMGKRLSGFDHPDALLTAPETRFSSPVRILRGETLESASHGGIYPCGEGCGYAGGIMSSAADGLRVAEKIFEKYEN